MLSSFGYKNQSFCEKAFHLPADFSPAVSMQFRSPFISTHITYSNFMYGNSWAMSADRLRAQAQLACGRASKREIRGELGGCTSKRCKQLRAILHSSPAAQRAAAYILPGAKQLFRWSEFSVKSKYLYNKRIIIDPCKINVNLKKKLVPRASFAGLVLFAALFATV